MPLENNQQDLQQANWSYNPTQNTPQAGNNQQDTAPTLQDIEDSVQDQGSTIISWTASEFIAYDKGPKWYLAAFGVALVLSVLTFFVTSQDKISTVFVFGLIMLLIFFAKRQPRIMSYAITNKGIVIGNTLFSYNSLKSFAIIDEGAISSIDILPLKRFMPSISMYYEPQDEAKITEALGAYLPKDERKQALIDKLMHKIRF